MFENLLLLLGSPAGSAGTGSGSSSIASFLPFILIFVVMYFLIIRPQSKKQKTMKDMLANLSKGDTIVTAGGIHGTISEVKDKTVIVKISNDTKIEFEKSSISTVRANQKADKKSDNSDKDSDKKISDKKSDDSDKKSDDKDKKDS